MLVELAVPCQRPPPGGWPVVLNVGGTGTGPDATGFQYDHYPVGEPLPFVVVSIPPVFGALRLPDDIEQQMFEYVDLVTQLAGAHLGSEIRDLLLGELPPADLAALAFFNFLNPVAARGNQMQQAADMLALRASIADFVLPAEAIAGDFDVAVDGANALASGHSQGALTLRSRLPQIRISPRVCSAGAAHCSRTRSWIAVVCGSR